MGFEVLPADGGSEDDFTALGGTESAAAGRVTGGRSGKGGGLQSL